MVDEDVSLQFTCPRCKEGFELEIARDSHEEFCAVVAESKFLRGWPLAEGLPSIDMLRECASEQHQNKPWHTFTAFTDEELLAVIR